MTGGTRAWLTLLGQCVSQCFLSPSGGGDNPGWTGRPWGHQGEVRGWARFHLGPGERMTLPYHFQATPWSGDSGLGWPGVLEVAHLVMPLSCGVSVMSSLDQKMSKWRGGGRTRTVQRGPGLDQGGAPVPPQPFTGCRWLHTMKMSLSPSGGGPGSPGEGGRDSTKVSLCRL